MTTKHPLFQHLEPGAAEIEHPTLDRAVAVSQAISLKRIADALDAINGKDPSRLGLVDGVMHAIEQGMITGRNG